MLDAKTMAQRSQANMAKAVEKCKRILRKEWNKTIKRAAKRGNFMAFWEPEPEDFSKYESFEKAFDELTKEYSELGYQVKRMDCKLIEVCIVWRP
jgi:phosphoribulokinase